MKQLAHPPSGIIRTLPSLWADPGNPGYRALLEAIKDCERNEAAHFRIALDRKPKFELLHLYLLVGGEINYRFVFVGCEPGSAAECWDPSYPRPKFWAVCTGPVERPPEPIRQRGFQGFRYTDTLW